MIRSNVIVYPVESYGSNFEFLKRYLKVYQIATQICARDMGCQLLLYPGAFNMTTGPAHWELLARARALDNQVYVATPSPARDESAGYVAWGHSSVIDPWGKVAAKAGHGEEIVYADINLDYMAEVRQQIPITLQRRNELYAVKKLK